MYADDAVSGAETKRLVNRQRLLSAIDSGPPFQALIMRDTSRFSRRDGDEAFCELKAIAKAGVEVWFYQDGQRFTFGTLAANVTGFLSAEFAADYRRQIAAWTYAAMEQKARAGHVTCGRVFGYDNVRVDGHVERRVNTTEAAVVRRIYDLYAAGQGLSSIAHTLNADGASCPRAQQGRVNGWCASSVREVLKRPLYRGDVVWGRARKRDREGQVSPTPRPSQEWLRRSAPELRVVSEDLAGAVDARRASMRQRALGQANGRLMGRPPGEGSPYLLTGLLTCGVCGGGMEVLSSASGGRRRYHYRCYVARRKRPACCTRTADVCAATPRCCRDGGRGTGIYLGSRDPRVPVRQTYSLTEVSQVGGCRSHGVTVLSGSRSRGRELLSTPPLGACVGCQNWRPREERRQGAIPACRGHDSVRRPSHALTYLRGILPPIHLA